jgi:hypothetical protein
MISGLYSILNAIGKGAITKNFNVLGLPRLVQAGIESTSS